MGVYYGERELARSPDEIAFAKVDLIVSQGPGTNGGTPLPEDRLTNGGAALATNELNPGTIVLLLPQDQTNRVATTLTLKAICSRGLCYRRRHTPTLRHLRHLLIVVLRVTLTNQGFQFSPF
jgi:hypothetical protein